MDLGSSYLPSEMNVAYLFSQLECAGEINARRIKLWNRYYGELEDLQDKGKLELPYIPDECQHNAHMFYIKVRDLNERTKLLEYLAEHGIKAVFHYVPLHTSAAGKKFGEFTGEDRYTTSESDRLIRLPMFFALKEEEVSYISDTVHKFFRGEQKHA